MFGQSLYLDKSIIRMRLHAILMRITKLDAWQMSILSLRTRQMSLLFNMRRKMN